MFMYYVYFLHSAKTGKFYIGQTSRDPRLRLAEHNDGRSQYTSGHRPYNLVYYESYHCRIDAEDREKFYKSGIGKQVRKLILQYFIQRQTSNN